MSSNRPSTALSVLGATGSIGASTLALVRAHADRFRLVAASGHRNVEEMLTICAAFRPAVVAMAAADAADELKVRLRDRVSAADRPRVLAGAEGLVEVATAAPGGTVVAAIVGAAGLEPTLAATRVAGRILLANKEALVMAGELFLDAVRSGGAELLPIDSEHNAIYQCLAGADGQRFRCGHEPLPPIVDRVLLTGSGGPFRTRARETLATVSPDEACRHPNWNMGRKISVDSATMMNKGLEWLEACLLFGAAPAQVEVVVHPESIVHSMVSYRDGSVLAQLGQPDMKTPIAHALACPDRIDIDVEPLDFAALGRLTFEAPDPERFPALTLAREALDGGGQLAVAMNAANEVAVEAFLQSRLSFTGITGIIEVVMRAVRGLPAVRSLSDVIAADAAARAHATQLVAQFALQS